MQKNQRNLMMGSMRTRVTDGQTDGRTDGAGYIGPAEGNGGSKKHMSKSRDIESGDKNNLETGPKWAQFGPNYFFRML